MPPSLSNNSAAVARFWLNRQNLLNKSGVIGSMLKWYVRHAEAYPEGSAGRKLVTRAARDVEAWRGELGRIGRMQAWQFAQVGDAVPYLFILVQLSIVGRLNVLA